MTVLVGLEDSSLPCQKSWGGSSVPLWWEMCLRHSAPEVLLAVKHCIPVPVPWGGPFLGNVLATKFQHQSPFWTSRGYFSNFPNKLWGSEFRIFLTQSGHCQIYKAKIWEMESDSLLCQWLCDLGSVLLVMGVTEMRAWDVFVNKKVLM